MKQSIRIIRSSRANVLLAVLIFVPSCFSVSSVWLTGRCEFCRPICILPWGITNIRSGVTNISLKSGALWRKKYAKFTSSVLLQSKSVCTRPCLDVCSQALSRLTRTTLFENLEYDYRPSCIHLTITDGINVSQSNYEPTPPPRPNNGQLIKRLIIWFINWVDNVN